MVLNYILLESASAGARFGAFIFAFSLLVVELIIFAISILIYLYRRNSKGESITFFQAFKENTFLNTLLVLIGMLIIGMGVIFVTT